MGISSPNINRALAACLKLHGNGMLAWPNILTRATVPSCLVDAQVLPFRS
jgi:hypothetical protein